MGSPARPGWSQQKGGHVEELRGRGGRNARGHGDRLGGGRGAAGTRAQQDFTLQASKIQRLRRDYNDEDLTVKRSSLKKQVFVLAEQYQPLDIKGCKLGHGDGLCSI